MPDSIAELVLPDGWQKLSVADALRGGWLLDLKDGNHGANHPKTSELSKVGLPFITAAQVRDFTIDYETSPMVDDAVLARLRVGFAQPGDAILTHKGSVGRSALCTKECVLTPQTTYYRPEQTALSAEFLVYLFASPLFRDQLAAVMSQTTRDFVPISEQYRLFLIVPPLREQDEITRRVKKMLDAMRAVEDRLAQSLSSTQSIPSVVLRTAFAGELVPPEAELARAEGRSYEPAEELLARVRVERTANGPERSARQPNRTAVKRSPKTPRSQTRSAKR